MPAYEIAVRVTDYLADDKLRNRVRDAAVRLVRAFVADQPDELGDIAHVRRA